jgi:hypothetical protein
VSQLPTRIVTEVIACQNRIKDNPIMSIKNILLVVFLSACTVFGFSEDKIDQLLQLSIGTIEKKADNQLVVSLGSFVFQDKNVGSGFGALLEQKLARILGQSKKIKYFAKDKLEEILGALELSVSDLADPKTSPRIGKLQGIGALLFGKYFDDNTNVKVYLDLVKIETGISIASAEVSIPKSEIPPTLSILPDNYNDAMFVLDQLSDVTGKDSDQFAIKLWTVRGNGATFRDGEEMVINFFANKDCYIKVFHIDVNGKVELIFPNKYYKDSFVKKSVVNKIPDSRYPFKFVLGKPFGTEFIKVIASTTPFKEVETAFSELGAAKKELFTKGLNVEEKTALTAEAMINYTIIQK